MSIALQKGYKISLNKADESALKYVVMGLGWDVAKPKGVFGMFSSPKSVDLDASCLLFSGKDLVDTIWFRQLKSKCGSIQHTGDNTTGEGEGDDEKIIVSLEKVPANVTSIVFTINSFSGIKFNQIENAFCRLVNLADNSEIAKFTISGGGENTAFIMAKLYRHNGEWKLAAIGEPGNGRTFRDLLPVIESLI